jgi:MFS family permease
VNTLVTPYAKELGVMDVAGFFFIVIAIAIFISRPFTGRWFDSKGENFVMYPAIPVFGIGLLVLSQARNGMVFLVAAALIGLGFGIIQASGQAIAVKVSPPHRLGLANSTYYAFFDAGAGVGPFLLGFLAPVYGYSGLYVCAGLVLFGTTILYFLLHGRNAVAPTAIGQVDKLVTRD